MIIVGLGNPGKEYEKTHHNIGFMFADSVAKELGIEFKLEKKFNAMVAEFKMNNEKHYLLKPLTYMNLSGNAVRPFSDYYKIPVSDIFIVQDDMDLPCGKRRIRKNGSAGGHNGLKSLISCLGTSEIKRLRIGIGRDKSSDHQDVVDFVLAPFSKKELSLLEDTLNNAGNIVTDLINNNIDYIMNKYN